MFPVLSYYAQFLNPEDIRSFGYLGCLLELAIKDFFGLPLVISPAGKPDLKAVIYDGKAHYIESKENGGDFYNACKGTGIMCYAIYIDENKTLPEQFGYVMPMSVFRSAGYALNHIRSEKIDKNGYKKMALQTLYNYKEDDFHGKKAFKLIDLWEDGGAITFKDCFKK